MKPLIIGSFFSVPSPFSVPTTLVPLSLNGLDGVLCRPLKSGGTGVPCEARRSPFSPVVNEEAVQSVDSPFPHSSSPTFFLPSPFVPTLWLTSECKVLSFMCVYVWPMPISTLLFGIVNSANRLRLLIYSLARLGLCVPVWLGLGCLIG